MPERSLCLIPSFGLPFNPLPMVGSLFITAYQLNRLNCVGNPQWLEPFRPFVGVKNLYFSKEVALCIAQALQDLVRGRALEVFPALQNVFLKDLLPTTTGPVHDSIMQFSTTRRNSSHPILVSVSH